MVRLRRAVRLVRLQYESQAKYDYGFPKSVDPTVRQEVELLLYQDIKIR